MISTLSWVRRGIAKANPQKYQMNEDEYERICKIAELQLESAKEDLQRHEVSDAVDTSPLEGQENIIADLAEYKLDEYDNEDAQEPEIFSAMGSEPLAVYRDNADDAYITVKDEEDEDEKEDLEIKPTDSLILVGKTEEDISHLEVYVYDTITDSLYIHHDIMLPSFPLCIEPINYDINDSRNWCAIGTFDHTIEVWNLDMVDVMYPHSILGLSADQAEKKKKKKSLSKKKLKNVDGHNDAILALSWNTLAQNFLLSASADNLVILWDLQTAKPVRVFNHHKDKVSCVKWHPKQPSLFVSAGYDKKICLVDAKSESNEPLLSSSQFNSDIECISWDPHSMNTKYGAVVLGCDNGMIHYLRIHESQFETIVSISAFSTSLTSVEVHPHIPGFILTTAAESSNPIQVWDLDVDAKKATVVSSRDVGSGKIFSGSLCPDDPYLSAFGGSLGQLSVWNITDNRAIVKKFHGRSSETSGVVNMHLPHAIQLVKGNDAGGEVVSNEVDDMETEDETEIEAVLNEMRGA